MSTGSKLHLILGGARSGKSRYAEQQAAEMADHLNQNVTYIATAQAFDSEMRSRIEKHQSDRPQYWKTLEVPLELSTALEDDSLKQSVVLVDCLTLWMMNLMEDADALPQRVDEFIDTLSTLTMPVYIVSNEISMGVVPMGEMSRQYVDELGRLHQKIASVATSVTLMVAGIPLAIK